MKIPHQKRGFGISGENDLFRNVSHWCGFFVTAGL